MSYAIHVPEGLFAAGKDEDNGKMQTGRRRKGGGEKGGTNGKKRSGKNNGEKNEEYSLSW